MAEDGVIVFIGDSITDCDRLTDRSGLGYGYVDMAARAMREHGDTSTVVNKGVAGDRVDDLRHRWQVDVLDHHPALLSVHIGVNDTLAAFFQGRPTPHDVFEARYTDILDRAAAAGVQRLILVEPFFVDTALRSVRWGEGHAFIQEDLPPRQRIVRDLAERYRAALVPLQSIVDAAADRGPTMIAADGVHPTPLGHRLIAEAWLAAYGAGPTG